MTDTTRTDDVHRRNPARDVEKFAVRVVRSWLGHRGEVEDMSAGHDPDFRLRYRDGRSGWGEVAWHEDRALREMWSLTFQQVKHQQVALPAGEGMWAVSLVKGARIKQLYRELPDFIGELTRQGCNRLEVIGNWPPGTLADTARRLGIEYLEKSEWTPDVAIYFMPDSGGTVPMDPDLITDWVSDVLADPCYSDTTRKLLDRDADERHVFLMSGSRTPFGADERLRRLREAVPNRSPVVPDGISHVWVVSHFGDGPATLWSRGTGWSVVEIPQA